MDAVGNMLRTGFLYSSTKLLYLFLTLIHVGELWCEETPNLGREVGAGGYVNRQAAATIHTKNYDRDAQCRFLAALLVPLPA